MQSIYWHILVTRPAPQILTMRDQDMWSGLRFSDQWHARTVFGSNAFTGDVQVLWGVGGELSFSGSTCAKVGRCLAHTGLQWQTLGYVAFVDTLRMVTCGPLMRMNSWKYHCYRLSGECTKPVHHRLRSHCVSFTRQGPWAKKNKNSRGKGAHVPVSLFFFFGEWNAKRGQVNLSLSCSESKSCG